MTIVTVALSLKPEERESYIRSACGTDQRLYEKTLETVDWEQKMGDFLQHPIAAFPDLSCPFEPGEIVAGRFEIIRKVGEGGMGVVYEAFDRKRNQAIAIKIAKPGYGRLLSPELEGALSVRHPNVCLVNEIHAAQTRYGEVDFLTMELLQGETLSCRLARLGRLPTDEALDIARQLCAGLKEAHKSQVIHRDLKAGNVIVCSNGSACPRAVITDFGLSGEAENSGYFGTPRYMAPELLLGQKASRASDIYALGVILYEMETGFSSDSSVQTEAPKGEISRSYQWLVAEFLSLEPARRYRAFEHAIQKLNTSSPWTRRAVLFAGASALCTISSSTWMERDSIEDWVHPLPRKRFVALCAWPHVAEDQATSLVSNVLGAIENELARAEAEDRELLVISSRHDTPSEDSPEGLRKFAASLGANLVLQASAVQGVHEVGLRLKVLDASTSAVLRKREVVCGLADISLLAAKTVRVVAGLLSVRWQHDAAARLRPSTDSAVALRAFLTAEELRKKPNDDGLTPAIERYKEAIDADNSYADAYGRLAMAYCRLYAISADTGALDLARANADKAIRLDGKSVSGHLASAEVFKWRGDFEQALRGIQSALELDPGNARTVLWQAQLYQKFGLWTKAEQAYLRLQKERPNYWVAHQELGGLFADQGRYEEALKEFRVAAVAAPGFADSFNNMGAIQIRFGSVAQAEQSYRRSLAIKRNALACVNLAEALRVQGKYADALALNREAVMLSSSNDQYWLGLGDTYEAMGDREKQAVDAYRRAATEVEQRLQTDPSVGSDWIRLALYRVKVRSGRQVAALIKRSEERGQLEVDSELVRARVLELLGKRGEALSVIDDCLARGTTGFEVAFIRDFGALLHDARYTEILKMRTGSRNK